MRCFPLGALALCLLLTACGPGDPPEAVPIGGGGGSGGSSGAVGGGSVGGVAILSHNAGQDCLSCHKTGGAGASKGIFTVAGTVYQNGGPPQTLATVMVYPNGSTTASATLATDGLGNFFTTQPIAALVPAPGQQFALGAKVVVKPNSGTSRGMLGVITNGSCNACHSSAGGVARVTASKTDLQGVSIQSAGGEGESLPAGPSAASIPLAQIATGAMHGCVVTSDGGVRCWGSNDQGQLGNTTQGIQATPIAVASLGQVSASTGDHSIAAGDNHTCVLASGGIVLCWGANGNGQLGNGAAEAAAMVAPSISGTTAVSASGDSTCARTGSGSAALFYCWGAAAGIHSAVPQLVDVDAVDRPDALIPLLDLEASLVESVATPSVVGLESTSFAKIATAGNHGCGITTDNHVKCWEGTHASVDVPIL